MDTPIKLTLQKYDYNSDEKLGIPRLIELDLSSTVLFSFPESDYLTACFDFDSTIYQIEYEDYETGELKGVRAGETFVLSYGREDKGSYFPGNFILRVITGKRARDYLFRVDSPRVEAQSVQAMRQYVDDFCAGLSKDVFKRRKKNTRFAQGSHGRDDQARMLFLLNNLPILLNEINQYFASHHGEITKKTMISSAPGRPDAKSVRWLLRKGLAENRDLRNPERILVRKTCVSVDNQINRLFKAELLFWDKELAFARKKLRDLMAGLDQKMISLVSEKDRLVLHYEEISDDKRISSRAKTICQNQIITLQKDMEDYQSLLSRYTDGYQKITRAKADMESILYHTWVKNIPGINEPIGSIADYRIRLMVLLHNEYTGVSSRNRPVYRNEEYVYGEKCTPKLFETFVYILLVNMLVDQGYTLKTEVDNPMLLFSESSHVYLQKADQYIDIFYDQDLKMVKDADEDSQYVWLNSDHHRPDFILSFRQADKVVDAKVVEAKWRPFSAIYNERDDTDIVRTLRDYYALAYHQKGEKRNKRDAISRVIVVYPDKTEKVTDIMNDDIVSIGLYPGTDIRTSKGYESLREALLDNISSENSDIYNEVGIIH